MTLHVITGGVRSGKSRAAETLAERAGDRVVVVVAGRDDDPEMTDRIRSHRRDRANTWQVVEVVDPTEWWSGIDQCATLVLDCWGSLVARVMDALMRESDISLESATAPDGFESAVLQALDESIEYLTARPGLTVVVTNEVGDGVVPQFWSGRVFRDVVGRSNRSLVDGAASAHLMVCGRCIDLDGLPATPDPDVISTKRACEERSDG